MVRYSRANAGIIALSDLGRVEQCHALRVKRFALRLFDDLQPLHRMGNTERIWLRTAALLHDVGKVEDPKRHHKVAFDIIVNSPELPLRYEERWLVALIARYHRGPLPHEAHSHFGALEADEQRCVAKLAALLRLADGLDKGRSSLVDDVRCQVRPQSVLVQVRSRDLLAIDKVLRKADLFEHVFATKIVISIHMGACGPQFGLASALDSLYAEAV